MPIAPSAFSFIWSFRLENDPGSRWFRNLVMQTYQDLRQSVVDQTGGRGIIKARKPRK